MVQQTLKSVRPAANEGEEERTAKAATTLARRRSLRIWMTPGGGLIAVGAARRVAFSPGLLSRRVTSPEVDNSRTSVCVRRCRGANRNPSRPLQIVTAKPDVAPAPERNTARSVPCAKAPECRGFCVGRAPVGQAGMQRCSARCPLVVQFRCGVKRGRRLAAATKLSGRS